MSEPATQVRQARPRPAAKELRAMQKRMKSGYRFDRTSAGHWRVIDVNGRYVEHDGTNITVSGNPSPGVLRALEDQLREAGVFVGTKTRITDEANRARAAGLRVMHESREALRQEEAIALFERLDASLGSFIPLDSPQLTSDLGAAGAIIAREQGKPMTPDLLTQSARRVVNRNWVDPRYQEVWQALCKRLEEAADKVGEWYLLIREAKGLDGDRVQVRTPDKSDWPFEVQLLPLEVLMVDPSYQRPPAWPFVRREAARFDATLVGTIDVAQRGPAVYATLDGQQRVEIVRLQGITSVWASVYQGLDKASEARFFLHKNRDRKNVHPYHLLMARLTAQDAAAQAIVTILDSIGYKPSIGAPRDDRPDNISAIAALEIAYGRHLPDGTNSLEVTMTILRSSAYGRPMGGSGILIRGVSRVLTENEADPGAIERMVMSLGPELLVNRARDVSRRSGGSAEAAMANVLMSEHRRHLNGKAPRAS